MACVFFSSQIVIFVVEVVVAVVVILFFFVHRIYVVYLLCPFFHGTRFEHVFAFVVLIACIIFLTPVFVTLLSTFRDLYAHA